MNIVFHVAPCCLLLCCCVAVLLYGFSSFPLISGYSRTAFHFRNPRALLLLRSLCFVQRVGVLSAFRLCLSSGIQIIFIMGDKKTRLTSKWVFRYDAGMNWSNIIFEISSAGYTQQEIAVHCGCTQSTISDIANGVTKNPSYHIGKNLSDLHTKTCRKRKRAA